MLCGLSIGMSLREMRGMRMTDVANIVSESTRMRPKTETEETVRDATQADIDRLKGI